MEHRWFYGLYFRKMLTMENLYDFIAELKRLSNLEHCFSAHDMQCALEKISDRLNDEFPNVEEAA